MAFPLIPNASVSLCCPTSTEFTDSRNNAEVTYAGTSRYARGLKVDLGSIGLKISYSCPLPQFYSTASQNPHSVHFYKLYS